MASLNINTILLHKVGLVRTTASLGDTAACSSDAETAGTLPCTPPSEPFQQDGEPALGVTSVPTGLAPLVGAGKAASL